MSRHVQNHWADRLGRQLLAGVITLAVTAQGMAQTAPDPEAAARIALAVCGQV